MITGILMRLMCGKSVKIVLKKNTLLCEDSRNKKFVYG